MKWKNEEAMRGYEKRLAASLKNAVVIPWEETEPIVLISDCHRGCGNQGDNFLKNRNLYLAALKYYLGEEYMYIELGDGDELWENRSMKCIQQMHADVFELLKAFQDKGKLYQLYGNHDYANRKDKEWIHNEAFLLKGEKTGIDLYLVHGHQVSFLNAVLWKLARFLVRYLWKPLEMFGLADPTSAARNYKVKEKHEKRLSDFAEKHQIKLVTGHTHRAVLGSCEKRYFNTGSCISPGGITCMEIIGGTIYLIEWKLDTDEDKRLYVKRRILEACSLTEISA